MLKGVKKYLKECLNLKFNIKNINESRDRTYYSTTGKGTIELFHANPFPQLVIGIMTRVILIQFGACQVGARACSIVDQMSRSKCTWWPTYWHGDACHSRI